MATSKSKSPTQSHTVWIVAGVVLALVVILGLWIASSYNGLVGLDVGVQQKWANVQADYQRRADLIPNLVATVKQYTNYEGPTLEAVTAARSAWATASTPAQQQAAANSMDSAISRLLVTVEAYPNLKANEQFLGLQDELSGTENRIKVSRMDYNAAIAAYDQKVRSFPVNLVAGMFGFSVRPAFEAQAGADVAPNVGALFGNSTG